MHRTAPTPARAALAAFALAIVCVAPQAVVQAQVVIYRCTDARGEITLQNDVPCPKGSKQVKRVMEAPPPAAPYVPAPAPAPPPAPVAEVAPAPAAPSRPPSPLDALPPPAIADADRLPPPALFECRTWDNDSYLDERGTPPPRCVTLSTTGLGGYVEGAGAACEMKTDSCQRIPDGALCDSWRRRLREAESVLRFGVSEDQDKARADLERIALVVRDSTCGL
jgi:hypothetical protein